MATIVEKPKKRGLFRRLLWASHSSLKQHKSSASRDHPIISLPIPQESDEQKQVARKKSKTSHNNDNEPALTHDHRAASDEARQGANDRHDNHNDTEISNNNNNNNNCHDNNATIMTNSDDPEPRSNPQLLTPESPKDMEEEKEDSYRTTLSQSPDLEKDPEIATVPTPSTEQATELAAKLLDGQADFIGNHKQSASWLGDFGAERAEVRQAYMNFFDWSDKSVLTALRGLCDNLYLKAESQQLDRIIDAFAERWCDCNPQHGFKSPGVIYTMAYSILLLNTDHHSEDYQGNKKMSRSQYINQTLDTIRKLLKAEDVSMADSANDTDLESITSRQRQNSIDSMNRPSINTRKRWSMNTKVDDTTFVCDGSLYNKKEWEQAVVGILKNVYYSIEQYELNLAHCSQDEKPHHHHQQQQHHQQLQPKTSFGSLRSGSSRQGSLLSRFSLSRRQSWSQSVNDTMSDYEMQSIISNKDTNHKNNSNNNTNNNSSSNISNSSNSKSLLKRRSVFSDYSSGLGIDVGFSGALRNTMIREEIATPPTEVYEDREKEEAEAVADKSNSNLTHSSTTTTADDSMNSDAMSMTTADESFREKATPSTTNNTGDRQDVDALALHGAPWNKEGLLNFQAFFDSGGVGKKYKKKNWVQVFVVVSRGYLKMFRFDHTSSSSQNIAHRRGRRANNNNNNNAPASMYGNTSGLAPVSSMSTQSTHTASNIGAGNWLDSATMTDNIALCHCMAQVNPTGSSEDSSKSRKRTSIIATSSNHASTRERERDRESGTTQWSLALPSDGGTLVFTAGTREIAEEFVYACNYWAARISKEPLVEAVSSLEFGWERPLELLNKSIQAERPAAISSSSFDTIVVNHERCQVKEWKPPILSAIPSDLSEADQLQALNRYAATVSESLEAHSRLRSNMMQVFKPGHLVSTRAHSNWEARSNHLLKETIKYDVYVSTLQRAMQERSKFV